MYKPLPNAVAIAIDNIVDYIISRGKKAEFFICATSEDDNSVRCVNYGNEYMSLASHLKHVRDMIDRGEMSRAEVSTLVINMLYGEGEDDD